LSDESYDLDLLQKRQLLPIHRIVLGLSKVSLDAQLEISSLEINTADYYGRRPLSWAAGRGDSISTEMLINYGASHAITDQGGWTALHHAVRAESPDCIPVLLQAGAAVDAKNNRGNTPLAVACSYRDSLAHILPLLEAGADPNATMASGLTPLAIAGQHNFIKCIEILVSHGARINYAGTAGLSLPLHASARYNSHAALRLILENGAATDLHDTNGWSLLHHVALSGDISTMEILCKSRNLFGLDPGQQENNGLTPSDVFFTLRKGRVNEDEKQNEKSREAFEKLLEMVGMYTWAKSPISDQSFASTASEVDQWFDSMEKMETSIAELSITSGEDLISL
jgi:ankyrin repeat protein